MTYAAPCIVCKSVVRQDLSSIKTDGAHNACVPALWSGFEKENILMFARETATNGGGIVTGDCGTMQSGSMCTKCTNCIWAVCTSGGSSIAQSITMSQPALWHSALWQSALWQSVRSPQDPPSPICNSLSETVTSDLQHFKHLQNLQLAGAVSDLQHLAPPQSHLVSIIAFHSSHLVSNCN